MSFVNAIISEEDAQFELYGHYKIWWEYMGIWSTYYCTDTLVRKAVKDYIEQSQQGLGPLNLYNEKFLCHNRGLYQRSLPLFLDQKKMDSVTKLFILFGLVMKPTIAVWEYLEIGQK